MLTIGYVLAGLVGIGIIGLGVRFLVNPQVAARDYGVAPEGAPDRVLTAFLATKGLRDIVSGIAALALLWAGVPKALAIFLAVASLIAFGDAAIVLRAGGARKTAFGVHAAAGVMILVTVILILAAR
jgi:hypothetical protein